MPELIVYPSKTNEILGITFAPLVAIGCVAWLIGASHLGWNDAWTVAAAGLFTVVTIADIRQIIQPLPQLILDEEGFEGTFGRERWTDVARARIRWRWIGRTVVRRVVFELRGAARPMPTARAFASWLVAGRTFDYGDRIETPLWGPKARVVADIQRFYDGEIDA